MRGKPPACFRRPHARGRVGCEVPGAHEEAEERAHGGELARDRRARKAAVEGSQPVTDRLRAHRARVAPRDRQELAHVGQVRAQRVRRGVPLALEVHRPRGERRRSGGRVCRHTHAMLSTQSGRDKVTRMNVRALLLVLAGVLLAGCRPDPSTARGTAERFLDAYYVMIDLRGALPYTAGLARDKVERGIALTAGQAIDASTEKPAVRYALLDEHPAGADVVQFAYRGTVSPPGSESFERRWLLTVRRGAAARRDRRAPAARGHGRAPALRLRVPRRVSRRRRRTPRLAADRGVYCHRVGGRLRRRAELDAHGISLRPLRLSRYDPRSRALARWGAVLRLALVQLSLLPRLGARRAALCAARDRARGAPRRRHARGAWIMAGAAHRGVFHDDARLGDRPAHAARRSLVPRAALLLSGRRHPLRRAAQQLCGLVPGRGGDHRALPGARPPGRVAAARRPAPALGGAPRAAPLSRHPRVQPGAHLLDRRAPPRAPRLHALRARGRALRGAPAATLLLGACPSNAPATAAKGRLRAACSLLPRAA